MIRQVLNGEEKRKTARQILEALEDWFQQEESRESYIADSAEQVFFAAEEEGRPMGFLCLKETGKDTVELAVMGVLQEYHRQGTGKALVDAAKAYAAAQGYSFLQVKTVKMGVYEDYDRTNRFYQAMGFREFEVIPTLWGEHNPCQIYVMALTSERPEEKVRNKERK